MFAENAILPDVENPSIRLVKAVLHFDSDPASDPAQGYRNLQVVDDD